MKLPGFEDIEGLTKKGLEAKPSILNIVIEAGEKSFTAEEIGRRLRCYRGIKLREETVRAVLSLLRLIGGAEGQIASNGKGFRYARTPEELDETIEHLEGRIRHISRVLQAVRRTQQSMRCHLQQQIRMF